MLVTLAFAALAHAQTEPVAPPAAPPSSAPTDEDRRIAHEQYEQGKAAFEAHDYLQAARLFLAAYARAPHHDPLWNAARSYELAGEKVRAANLYTLYLELAPMDARDRARATETRKELADVLGRLDIQGHAKDVTVDDQPASTMTVFVDPGQHIVRGKIGGQPVETVVTVSAGAALSVALQAPASALAVAPPPPPAQIAEAPSHRKPLPPVVFYIGAGLTAVATGLTIASGVDTLNAKSAYDTTGNPSLIPDGQSKQDRTNALFWTTLGLGVTTAALGILLVDWGHSKGVRAAITPGSAFIGGVL
jgi:tetratricopeptide (TPR) repeat protein